MVIAASIIAGRALAPIEGAIEGWNQFLLSRGAYERIQNLLKSSPLNFERFKLPRPEGRLDVERLLYVPGGTKRVVLNGIAFPSHPAIPWPSSAIPAPARPRLARCWWAPFSRLRATSASTSWTCATGINANLARASATCRRTCSCFPATIKANIARMRYDATDADIYRAAELADVHEMIASLPQGYETMIAADGAPLSGGQKQRIALARAFFGSPKLVVLDEPNSNLDGAGDEAPCTRASVTPRKPG